MRTVENFVVIHLSASAVYTVVARPTARHDGMEVMAIGMALTDAFVGGKIAHRERLLVAVKKSIRDAEEMANVRIVTATLCLSTPTMRSVNTVGSSVVAGERIENADMAEALTHAKKTSVAGDYYLTQFAPLMVWLDDEQHEVKDPVGMTGVRRLQVSYHLMSLPSHQLNNLYGLFADADVSIDHVIFGMVAGAQYSLLPDERKRGVIFIDIGADMTSVAVYKENVLLLSQCLAVGGQSVTMDISAELSVSMAEADVLKKQYASLMLDEVSKHDFLPTNTNGGGVINRYRLSQVVQARYHQIFDEVLSVLTQAGWPKEAFEAGVVLSGGGALMKDIVPYLRKQWMLPVGLANLNTHITIDAPHLSDVNIRLLSGMIQDRRLQTALGAMLYHLSDEFAHRERIQDDASESEPSTLDKLLAWFEHLIAWIKRLV